MPNGNSGNSNEYNRDWCDERHIRLDNNIEKLENCIIKMNENFSTRYHKILWLLISNFASIITALILMLLDI